MLVEDESESMLIYKALSTDARWRILDILSSEGPMDLKDISKKIGLKEVTVRHHLLIMERAGLIESYESGEGLPGRPRRYYRVVKKYRNIGVPKRQYALLAKHLIESFIELNGKESLVRIMREMGERIADELLEEIKAKKGSDKLELDDLQKYVIPMLDSLGCVPSITEISENVIKFKMNNCIFYELSKAYPRIICERHKSFFQKLGDELGKYEAVSEKCLAEGDDFCITALLKKK